MVSTRKSKSKTAPPVKVGKSAKAKVSPDKKKKAAKKEVPKKKVVKGSGKEKKVEIEACKQWGAFKTRANKILKAVGQKAVVEINKEKVSSGMEIWWVDSWVIPHEGMFFSP